MFSQFICWSTDDISIDEFSDVLLKENNSLLEVADRKEKVNNEISESEVMMKNMMNCTQNNELKRNEEYNELYVHEIMNWEEKSDWTKIITSQENIMNTSCYSNQVDSWIAVQWSSMLSLWILKKKIINK